MNDKAPRFQGLDVNGQYPAAVSDYTQRGDRVIYVSAIDLDTSAPNNVVGELYYGKVAFMNELLGCTVDIYK